MSNLSGIATLQNLWGRLHEIDHRLEGRIMEEEDFRSLKNPFDDDIESCDDRPESDFLSKTFDALLLDEVEAMLDEKITLDAPGKSNAKAPPRPTTPAPTLNPKAPARPTTPAPTKTPEQIETARLTTASNIASAREKYEKAFPETFSTESPENMGKLKVLNIEVQKEIEACAQKHTAISPDRANDIYTSFLLSDIIEKTAPSGVQLGASDLATIKSICRKQITELRSQFSAAKIDLPPGIEREQLRKSKTVALYRLVSEQIRDVTDIDEKLRLEVKASVEAELGRLLKFTDQDLGTGFLRNTASEDVKKVVKELKWHLEPNAIKIAEGIVFQFKQNFSKAVKSKEARSMAAQFLIKDNGKLFDLLAKTIEDSTQTLVKQKLPVKVKHIVNDIFLIVDSAAEKNIKNDRQAAVYAMGLKRQILPFVFLNGYGGTITNKFAINLTGSEASCATYIWQVLMRLINSVGAAKKEDAKAKDTPKPILKAAEKAGKEIEKYFDGLFSEVQNFESRKSI